MANGLNKIQLSQHLRPLFWSYDFENLDLEKHRKLIVKQILNYGTIEDWKWLVKIYTQDLVRETILDLSRKELKKNSAKLAEILFKIDLPE